MAKWGEYMYLSSIPCISIKWSAIKKVATEKLTESTIKMVNEGTICILVLLHHSRVHEKELYKKINKK